MKMRVVFLASWFSTPNNPTAGIFFREQFNYIKKYLDWECHLFACEILYPHQMRLFTSNNYSETSGINHSYGFSLGRISQEKRQSKITDILLKNIVALDKSIDHIICFSGLYASEAAYKLHEQLGIRYSIIEHSSLFIGKHSEYIKSLKKYYHCSSQVAAVSQTLSKELKELFEIKCVTINNPVTVPTFEQQTTQNKNITFINVSNYTSNKNVIEIVKAFKLYLKFNPKSTLELIGNGPEKRKVQKYIKTYSLSKQVIMQGRLEHDEVIKRLKNCNIYVNGSFVETFGIAPLEALLSGLKLVTTPCGGVDEFVTDFEHTILVPGFSAMDIMLGMRQASDSSFSICSDQLNAARQKFSVQNYINKINLLSSS